FSFESDVSFARDSPRGIAGIPARAAHRHLADAGDFAGRNVERVKAEQCQSGIGTGFTRRGFVKREKLNHSMAEADREIDHRLHLQKFSAPEIVASAEREQRNQDTGRSLQHEE
ncbi:MAG TPA: hypothetical protein VKR29_02705, partial [Candidatus Binataceae bacterium]|nr:hypothetical protein [Candidatus Binataceae bacterium]